MGNTMSVGTRTIPFFVLTSFVFNTCLQCQLGATRVAPKITASSHLWPRDNATRSIVISVAQSSYCYFMCRCPTRPEVAINRRALRWFRQLSVESMRSIRRVATQWRQGTFTFASNENHQLRSPLTQLSNSKESLRIAWHWNLRAN